MKHYIIGLMSGTSLDGIDAALIDSKKPYRLLASHSLSMPQAIRQDILQLADPDSSDDLDLLGQLDQKLAALQSEAVQQLIQQANIQAKDVLIIASHGQTIRHRPEQTTPFSMQISSPSLLAEQTGISVINDFRSKDIAAGGQGAPLVPFAHQHLFQHPTETTAVLNIGGIANISYIDKYNPLMGFDTGPGNMLIDGIVRHYSQGQQNYDDKGSGCLQGKPCEQLLEALLAHPFLQQKPPKSSGREDFGKKTLASILAWPKLDRNDRLCTAAEFSIQSILQAIRFLPKKPSRWVICGGGVHNAYLMQGLSQQLAPAHVYTSDHLGWPSDSLEASCFAILGLYCLQGKSNVCASVTGARHDSLAGSITPARNWPKVLSYLKNL